MQVRKSFSAENTHSDVLFVTGPATVWIEEDPDGSTVDVEFSHDKSTWSAHVEDGVAVQFTAETKATLNVRGPVYMRLTVATGNYGGTPFAASLFSASGVVQ